MTDAFINSLMMIAKLLARFSESTDSSSLKWNGKSYVPAEVSSPDAQAAKWWGTLTAIVSMIKAQSTPLSEEQKRYLETLLFGGMGSLNDFSLDESRAGSAATQANRELDRLRKELFNAFQSI